MLKWTAQETRYALSIFLLFAIGITGVVYTSKTEAAKSRPPSKQQSTTQLPIEQPDARKVFDMTNLLRKQNGLPPLEWSDKLAAAGHTRNLDMIQNNYFEHINPKTGVTPQQVIGESDPNCISGGENISQGPLSDSTDEGIFGKWYLSPGHKANMLNSHYTHLGVSIDVRNGQYWASQEFCKQ